MMSTLIDHLSISSVLMHAPMPDIPMPGGWNMSSEWTRLCGRTWLRAAADFIVMWIAMMTAMMLPSFAPTLWRSRRAGHSITLDGAGYFGIWTLVGIAMFALGAPLAALVLRTPIIARAIPFASAIAMIAAGAMQSSAWKARRLACCAGVSCGGVRHGVRCVMCCAPLTLALIALGAMDARAMLFMSACICAERLMPRGERIAKGVGVMFVAIGCVMLLRA